MTELERGRHIARDEDFLNRHLDRTVRLDQGAEFAIDHIQTRCQTAAAGHHTTARYMPAVAAIAVDYAVAGDERARIDADNADHATLPRGAVITGARDKPLTQLLQHVIREIDVRVHILHIVQIFQRIEQAKHFFSFFTEECELRIRAHGDLGVVRFVSGRNHGIARRDEPLRRGHDLDAAVAFHDVFGTGFQRRLHQRVLAGIVRITQYAGGGEHETHRAGGAHIAAVTRERVPYLGHRAIAVVSHAVDHHCRAAGPVALVAHFVELPVVQLARATFDRATPSIARSNVA